MRLAILLLALVACGSKEKERDRDGTKDKPAVSAPASDAAKGAPLPELSPNAPQDRAVETDTSQEARIAELTEQARKTYADAKQRFLAGLPAGEHFFVRTKLTSPGATESVFIAVTSIADGQVKGTIANDIRSVEGYAVGDAYTFAETQLLDWMIAKPDGSEEGNVVGKYLDTLQK